MQNRKGQILLITVMLLATVMTIVLSVSFKSVTETQVTKLEEESQKALAAAESAIEVALRENSLNGDTNFIIGADSLSSITGFSGSATIQTAASKTFTTPSIPKDGSYTFYLGDYNVETKAINPSILHPYGITICFESATPDPAIEFTLVKSDSVKKYIIDPVLPSRITNASFITPCFPDMTNYSYSTYIPEGDIYQGQFLLVRVLYAPTKLFFSRDTNLPIQGRTVSSEATSSTSTGVSKKVVLFQSYPQIPGEFFTTTF